MLAVKYQPPLMTLLSLLVAVLGGVEGVGVSGNVPTMRGVLGRLRFIVIGVTLLK